MDQQTFAQHLARLCRHKIGIMEATALFAIEGPTPTAKIAERIGSLKVTARARLGILRKKKMITSIYEPDGTVLNSHSAYGSKIVNETLNRKAK